MIILLLLTVTNVSCLFAGILCGWVLVCHAWKCASNFFIENKQSIHKENVFCFQLRTHLCRTQ